MNAEARERRASQAKLGRIWVVPNRNAIGLVALLFAMGYAGASQANAAAYLLGFTIAGLALISTVHGWANLRGIQLSVERIKPVFAGQDLEIRVRFEADGSRPRHALRITAAGARQREKLVRLISGEPAVVPLQLPAEQRGYFEELQLELSSFYPLGFYTVRQRIDLRAPHYVYPQPGGAAPLPHVELAAGDGRAGPRVEGEDFAGVRAYQLGESQRHIDWKAVARGQPLLTKQWAGETSATAMFEWEQITAGSTEERLSQLARWVVQAERQGLTYGLRIPGVELPVESGDWHHHACLRALATFRTEDRA